MKKLKQYFFIFILLFISNVLLIKGSLKPRLNREKSTSSKKKIDKKKFLAPKFKGQKNNRAIQKKLVSGIKKINRKISTLESRDAVDTKVAVDTLKQRKELLEEIAVLNNNDPKVVLEIIQQNRESAVWVFDEKLGNLIKKSTGEVIVSFQEFRTLVKKIGEQFRNSQLDRKVGQKIGNDKIFDLLDNLEKFLDDNKISLGLRCEKTILGLRPLLAKTLNQEKVIPNHIIKNYQDMMNVLCEAINFFKVDGYKDILYANYGFKIDSNEWERSSQGITSNGKLVMFLTQAEQIDRIKKEQSKNLDEKNSLVSFYADKINSVINVKVDYSKDTIVEAFFDEILQKFTSVNSSKEFSSSKDKIKSITQELMSDEEIKKILKSLQDYFKKEISLLSIEEKIVNKLLYFYILAIQREQLITKKKFDISYINAACVVFIRILLGNDNFIIETETDLSQYIEEITFNNYVKFSNDLSRENIEKILKNDYKYELSSKDNYKISLLANNPQFKLILLWYVFKSAYYFMNEYFYQEKKEIAKDELPFISLLQDKNNTILGKIKEIKEPKKKLIEKLLGELKSHDISNYETFIDDSTFSVDTIVNKKNYENKKKVFSNERSLLLVNTLITLLMGRENNFENSLYFDENDLKKVTIYSFKWFKRIFTDQSNLSLFFGSLEKNSLSEIEKLIYEQYIILQALGDYAIKKEEVFSNFRKFAVALFEYTVSIYYEKSVEIESNEIEKDRVSNKQRLAKYFDYGKNKLQKGLAIAGEYAEKGLSKAGELSESGLQKIGALGLSGLQSAKDKVTEFAKKNITTENLRKAGSSLLTGARVVGNAINDGSVGIYEGIKKGYNPNTIEEEIDGEENTRVKEYSSRLGEALGKGGKKAYEKIGQAANYLENINYRENLEKVKKSVTSMFNSEENKMKEE